MLALERQGQARAARGRRSGGPIQRRGARPVRRPRQRAGAAGIRSAAQDFGGCGSLRRRWCPHPNRLRQVCSRPNRGTAGESSAPAKSAAYSPKELAPVRLVFCYPTPAGEGSSFGAAWERACRAFLDRTAADSNLAGAVEWSARFGNGLVASAEGSADRRRPRGHPRQPTAGVVPRVARREGWAFAVRFRGALSRTDGPDPDGLRCRLPFALGVPLVTGNRALGLGGVSAAGVPIRGCLQSGLQAKVPLATLDLQTRSR